MAMQELVKKLEYAEAQSVEGMNLAASIQDDYLACSPENCFNRKLTSNRAKQTCLSGS